jgi:predicted branched-subunit amino acid permease
MKVFIQGFKSMIPIIPGIIPFGAVMGSVSSEVGLSFFQTVMMNVLVFAGAAQLASLDLMKTETPMLIVLITGLIINLRFILYSAAYSPVMQKSKLL